MVVPVRNVRPFVTHSKLEGAVAKFAPTSTNAGCPARAGTTTMIAQKNGGEIVPLKIQITQ